MIGQAKIKLFRELDYDDFLYYINPFIAVNERTTPLDVLVIPTVGGLDQLIQGVKIKEVKGIVDDPNYRKWVEIEYFMPNAIVHSPDLEKIPTVKLRFNGERNFAHTLVKLEGYESQFPVPYCTDRAFLSNYIRSTR